MKTAFEHGQAARVHGCFRVLANPSSNEELREWQHGWDAADREEQKPFQQRNFERLTQAIGLPLTPEQEASIQWLAGWERGTCERIAHLFERVRAVASNP